jgi:hypothetical protein
MKTVTLTHASPDGAIPTIKALRLASRLWLDGCMSLRDAKAASDSVRDGEAVVIYTGEDKTADAVASVLAIYSVRTSTEEPKYDVSLTRDEVVILRDLAWGGKVIDLGLGDRLDDVVYGIEHK